MDPRFPNWYTAAAIEPKDDFLRKRWQGVEEFISTVSQAQAFELVRVFHGMGGADPTFAGAFEAAIQKHDAAFTATSRPRELAVLAGAALAHMVEKAPDIADTAALATVVHHCRGAGSKGSVPEIIQIQREHLIARSQQHRSVRLAAAVAFDPLDVDAGLAKAVASGALPEVAKELSQAVKPAVDRLNQLAAAFAELKEQQQYFREESNVLWWMTGGHSRDLDVPFGKLAGPFACLVAGKELADLSSSTVGPYAARAFLERLLRQTDPKLAEPIQLVAAVNAADRAWAQGWASGTFTHGAQDFCPVTLAIREAAKADGKSWAAAYKGISSVSANVKLAGTDLAQQVYEEALLLKGLGRTRGGA